MIDGFLIDPVESIITPVKIGSETTLDEVYELLGCEVLAIADYSADTNLIVDDNGLSDGSKPFFVWKGRERIFGRGVVLGLDRDSGQSISCDESLDSLRSYVSFAGEPSRAKAS